MKKKLLSRSVLVDGYGRYPCRSMVYILHVRSYHLLHVEIKTNLPAATMSLVRDPPVFGRRFKMSLSVLKLCVYKATPSPPTGFIHSVHHSLHDTTCTCTQIYTIPSLWVIPSSNMGLLADRAHPCLLHHYSRYTHDSHYAKIAG